MQFRGADGVVGVLTSHPDAWLRSLSGNCFQPAPAHQIPAQCQQTAGRAAVSSVIVNAVASAALCMHVLAPRLSRGLPPCGRADSGSLVGMLAWSATETVCKAAADTNST